MAADPTPAGPDDAAVAARYLAHRAAPTSPNLAMEEPAVLARLGDLAGLRVLDLGCGDGSFAATVLDRGAASYLGIDASPSMVERARAGGHGRLARFEVGAVERLAVAAGAFDLVTARMVLHHVGDLTQALHAIARSLVDGGRLLITVAHPVLTAPLDVAPGPRSDWTVDAYFDEGERRRPWFGTEVTWHHRTVERYLSDLLAAGLAIDGISECPPDPLALAGHPEELARRRRVPLVLLIDARRRPAATTASAR